MATWTSGPIRSPSFACCSDLGAARGASLFPPAVPEVDSGLLVQILALLLRNQRHLGQYPNFWAFFCTLLDRRWHIKFNRYLLTEWVINWFIVVQLPSHVWLFATPWTVAHQAFLSLNISWSWPRFTSMGSVMPSNHLILCHPLLLLLSVFPSIRVFFNESVVCIRWPNYWSFSFSISPFKEYLGWSLLVWTGWIFLQSKGLSRVSSSTTLPQHSGFFMVQLLSLYMTTRKSIALTIQTFVYKVQSTNVYLLVSLSSVTSTYFS